MKGKNYEQFTIEDIKDLEDSWDRVIYRKSSPFSHRLQPITNRLLYPRRFV